MSEATELEPTSDEPAEQIPGYEGTPARAAIEAILMVVDEPVTEVALATTLGLPVGRVHDLVEELAGEYDDDGRGFALRSVAGGWRLYSRQEYAPVVASFLMDGRRARLTQAALETLAVIAYRQPASKARVGAVRGVNVDGVVRTLMARGLIEEVGADAEHGAALYGTTTYFLERLGLGSLDELPPLAPHLPDDEPEPPLGALDGPVALEVLDPQAPTDPTAPAEPTDPAPGGHS